MPNWKKVIVSGSDASLNSLNVTSGVTGSLLGTASYSNQALSSSFASTASFVTNLNQNVLITGSATIGATSAGPFENTLTLGARDAANEGGQIGLNAPGGTYTSASFIDNWQNNIRILRGTNATSNATVASWNLHTRQMQLPAYTGASSFAGTATANLAVDSAGNVITVSTTGGTVFPYTGNAVITGSLTATTGFIAPNTNGAMYLRGGDDVELWDINISNHLGVYGQQDSTVASVKLGSGGGVISGKSGNIGIGTINPTANLDVIGTTRISGSLGVTGSFSVLDSIDSANKILIGSGPLPGSTEDSVNWDGRTLFDSNGNFSVRWGALRTMYDSSAVSSIDWQNRITIDTGTNTSIDWENRTMYASNTTASVAWDARFLLSSNGSRVVRWNTGLLQDNSEKTAVDWYNRQLQDDTNVTTVAWKDRRLYDRYATASINWDTRVLTDSTEVSALDWENRVGYAGGITTLDWGNLALIDTGGVGAIDWRNRILLDGAGTPRLNWRNAAGLSQILINAYSTNNIGLTTEAEPLANYSNYGNTFTPSGEIINDVTFNVGVSDYDLVSLDATGQWYQTAMNSNLSTKMLGIAFNVGLTNSVLLEGHMVVSSGSNGAPKVSNLTIGSAVYMNTTSSGIFMSNTAPVATGQAVRLLGHVYYNSTNDTTWYVMKFRPSNDWVTL